MRFLGWRHHWLWPKLVLPTQSPGEKSSQCPPGGKRRPSQQVFLPDEELSVGSLLACRGKPAPLDFHPLSPLPRLAKDLRNLRWQGCYWGSEPLVKLHHVFPFSALQNVIRSGVSADAHPFFTAWGTLPFISFQYKADLRAFGSQQRRG